MDSARVWPPADRLRSLAAVPGPPVAPLVDTPWVPDLGTGSARTVLWRLVADLVDALTPHLDRIPTPVGVSALDRLSWVLGGNPDRAAMLAVGGSGLVQAEDLGALLWLANVDRAGLDQTAGSVTLSGLVESAGMDVMFAAAAAKAEAGTEAPSPSLVRLVADAAGTAEGQVEAAWVAGALSWAPGSTTRSGLPVSRHALARGGAATVWQRRLLTSAMLVPPEWVAADGAATLADLAAIMDDTGAGPPGQPGEHWQWRIPGSGVVMTPETTRRGMLLLGCLGLEASPHPRPGTGPWVVGDSTVLRAADVVPGSGSALLVDSRTTTAVALFTLVAAVPDHVADADRFLRAQQGSVTGRAWPSSGVAVEALGRPART